MRGTQRCALVGALIIGFGLAAAREGRAAPPTLPDTPQNRSTQIERYFQAVPPESLMKDFAAKMSMRLPADQQARFVDLMTKEFDMKKLRSIMHDGMAKTFTADELRALADFYGSAVGKSATQKFGTYMSDVMPAIQAEFTATAERVKPKLSPPDAKAPAPAK